MAENTVEAMPLAVQSAMKEANDAISLQIAEMLRKHMEGQRERIESAVKVVKESLGKATNDIRSYLKVFIGNYGAFIVF